MPYTESLGNQAASFETHGLQKSAEIHQFQFEAAYFRKIGPRLSRSGKDGEYERLLHSHWVSVGTSLRPTGESSFANFWQEDAGAPIEKS